MEGGAAAKPRLSADELVKERLCLRTSKLVDEVYDLAKRQLATEERREANLSAKSVSLLSVTGLSLTVAFTFGGVLLQRPAYLDALGSWRMAAVVIPYVLAIACGTVASAFALWALLVRSDYREVEEHDVFGPELAAADARGEDGVVQYRRFMTAHLWLIYQETFAIHEAKARRVARGQMFFFGFLACLLPIGGAMTYSLAVAADPSSAARMPVAIRMEEHPQPKPSAPPTPAPSTESPPPPPTSVPTTGRRFQGSVDRPRQAPPKKPGAS